MQTWVGCDRVPSDLPPTAVTIGVFDGVHLGHRVLLDRVVAATGTGLLPVVVTFDPHPMRVLRPDVAPPLLTTLSHRLELLSDEGIWGTLVLPFTTELAAESAQDFAARVLAGTLRAREVVVGRNFRFGHRAAGDVALLADLGRALGFEEVILDLEPLPARSDGVGGPTPALSSTAIRSLIAQGDVVSAAAALGRPHRVSGPVVHGDHRGRELGFPTANVAVPDSFAIPGDGVYAARVRSSGDPGVWRPAAVSVGTNPTFGAGHRRIEAHVIGVPGDYDAYDQLADVEFLDRIRPMLRFEGVDQLVARMVQDVSLVTQHPGACLRVDSVPPDVDGRQRP